MSAGRLEGRRALITGAGAGIGAEIARRFAGLHPLGRLGEPRDIADRGMTARAARPRHHVDRPAGASRSRTGSSAPSTGASTGTATPALR